MELKLSLTISLQFVSASSNRTFMELKYVSYDLKKLFQQVLIVPLWN